MYDSVKLRSLSGQPHESRLTENLHPVCERFQPIGHTRIRALWPGRRPTHTLSSRTERSAVKDPQLFCNAGERRRPNKPKGNEVDLAPRGYFLIAFRLAFSMIQLPVQPFTRGHKSFPIKCLQISSLIPNICGGCADATLLESNI